MNWNSVNLEDAKKDTLGGGLQSGGYTIDIESCSIFRSPQSTFTQLTLVADVEGKKRYLKLTASGKDNKEGYDSKRITQLLTLLRVQPQSITETQTDRANSFLIPQIKGQVGALIEVRPAYSVKPNHEGKQYPELSILQFFNQMNGKTINEESNSLPAKAIQEHVPKLLTKEYKRVEVEGEFNNAPEVIPDDLPFN